MGKGPTIGFIGFGEAGFNIAIGLRSAGLETFHAFDINSRTPKLGERIVQRVQASEVNLVPSSEILARESDILFSTVTADRAVEAAEQTAPYLGPHHSYADLNSVSPSTKRTIAQIIKATGAGFIEAAVMAAVPPHRHRVPMLLGGAAAKDFAEQMAQYEMRLEVISEEVGQASAVKMCRSIMIKGLEALLLECSIVANHFGADERVFASLDARFPGMNWRDLSGYMIGRVIEHGDRRAREMEEVASMLDDAGFQPIMSEAIARAQQWVASLNIRDKFAGEVPETYVEVMRALSAAASESGTV
jgi:3-hydroxyisobutyrate dehydrogenase-like beta-hydroxyacid dehydrogenase